MTPLLGPDAFPGEWISAERAGATWVGEAWFDGIVVWTAIRRDAAEHALPAGWEPAPNRSEHGDLHPLVVLLGRQRRTSILFGGLTLPSDADYDEVMLAVPFVRQSRQRHLHVFIPRMYSEDRRATWSGNAQYGFAKRPGEIDRLGRTSVAVDEHGAALLHCSARPVDSWRRADGGIRESLLAAVGAASRLPVLGVRDDGSEIGSYFEWRFDEAWVRPAAALLVVHQRLAPGLDAAGVSADAAPALEVRRMRWRLSWPQPRRVDVRRRS